MSANSDSRQLNMSKQSTLDVLKSLVAKQETLEDKIFSLTLIVGTLVVLVSTIVTYMEELSDFATVCSALNAIFFIGLIVLTYIAEKTDLARILLCYFLNCFLLPVTFFSCGGIDSGMPLYLLAGLFVIVPVLRGRQRLICFIISLVMHISMIGISYNFMEGTKARHKINSDILATLSLEDRIVDMTASIILVAICLFAVTSVILTSYQQERENKEKLLTKLDTLSRMDELTGLYNRRELFHYLDETELFQTRRYYVAMIDIDHFKRVNDTYGHIFGDLVLRKVAEQMNQSVSSEEGEIASRYGGEEFVLMLRKESYDAAYQEVEELRKKIEALAWEEEPEFTVTISGGVSECAKYENVTQMLGAVDKLLYEAKQGGRNQISRDD